MNIYIWLSPATPSNPPHGHGPVCTLSDIADIFASIYCK